MATYRAVSSLPGFRPWRSLMSASLAPRLARKVALDRRKLRGVTVLSTSARSAACLKSLRKYV
jgi:hypothetical protein